MLTPYFVIHEKILKQNVREFQHALSAIWPNSQLAYSVKTNSLPWVLKFMQQNKVFAEVVSDEEYTLAKMCGFKGNDIIFNGPIKSEQGVKDAISDFSYVNLDSQNELNYISKACLEKKHIGLRININSDLFYEDDIEYMEDGFRFGYSEESGDLKRAMDILHSLDSEMQIGLHLHCNSITRSINVYAVIARYAAFIIKKYNLSPSYIDIGGGFFGGVEGKPTAEDYISRIRAELESVIDIQKTKLIIEPGSALIGSAVDLITSVIDVKNTAKTRIVTTDGSRLHIDPLWKKKGYKYSIKSRNEAMIDSQIICGYTCMDHDRLMCLKNERELMQGDQIIYHRVGAYSMTLGGAFIRYFPEVYVEKDGNTFLVRKRMTTRDYLMIQSV